MDWNTYQMMLTAVADLVPSKGWLKQVLCRFPGIHSRASAPTGAYINFPFGGTAVQYLCPRCNKLFWK